MPLDGTYAILRYWVKPIAVINTVPGGNAPNFFESFFRRLLDANIDRCQVDGCYDGGGDWQFVEQMFPMPTVIDNPSTLGELNFCAQDGSHGQRVALAGVQLFAVADPREQVPYIPDLRTNASYSLLYDRTSRIHRMYMPDDESVAYAGIDNLQAGAVFAKAADLNALRVAYENLRVHHESTAKVLNQMIRDGQARGDLAPFDMRALPNLKLWLHPPKSANVTTEDGHVSIFRDLSPNGILPFTQSTDNKRPRYRNSGINGHPALEFIAMNLMQLDSASLLKRDLITAFEDVWPIVIQPTSIATDLPAGSVFNKVKIIGDVGVGYRGLFLRSTGPTAQANLNDSAFKVAEATLPALGVPALVTMWHRAGTLYCQVNNGAVASVAASAVAGSATGAALRIGFAQAANSYYNGHLGDVVVFDAYDADVVAAVQEELRRYYELW